MQGWAGGKGLEMTMTFIEAQSVVADLAAASAEQLDAAWHSYARQISYHHADDSGKEWGTAGAMMPDARKIELEIRSRGLPRPTGEYLLSKGDRIDWETGEWSRGWDWKKAKAA